MVRIGALGDVLLTRRLTFSLSLAGFRSTLLAPARHGSLLLCDPWIDAVLDSESPRFAAAFAGAWPEDATFDLALVISDSEDLAGASGLAAARVLRIPPAPQRPDLSIARQWADAAHAVCQPFEGTLPRLGSAPLEAITVGATLLHPGSGSPQKNWPVARFIELARTLGNLGHRIAWIRGPAEAEFPAVASPDLILDRPSLQALAEALGRSRLYVGNDSGVSHLAAAMGAPSVVLFGPTSAAVWRPDGPRVRTVAADSLSDIGVEAVLAAADDLAAAALPGRP